MALRSSSLRSPALVLLGMLACSANRHRVELPATGGGTRLDVRRPAERPRLALLSRQGDPEPIVALAAASARGSTRAVAENRALAALLGARLERAGFSCETGSDGAGLRVACPAANAPRLVVALRAALAQPVAPSDLRPVERALADVSRVRTDAARLGVITCNGEAVLAPDEFVADPTAADLDRWRAETFALDAVALAAVGPESFTRSVATALDAEPPWPLSARSGRPPAASEAHGAGASSAVPEGRAQLDISFRLSDPRRAVQAALAFGAVPSPLGAVLAELGDWRLQDVRATALAFGGCVTLRLERTAAAPATIARSAAAAVGMARREIAAVLADPLDGRIVTAQIGASGDARRAAERAAWWAVAGLGQGAGQEGAPVLATALQLSALGRGTDVDAEALLSDYRADLPRWLGAPPAHIDRAVAVERGQGRVWLLLASDCALAQEGAFDAGMSALAMLSQAAASSELTVEPWLSSDGVGLLASGSPAAGEDGAALARRVASAAAAALTRLPIDPSRFEQAQAAALSAQSQASLGGLDRLASQVAPNHPSWLDPLGLLARQASATRSDAEARLRDLLRAPLRLAMLANEAQGQGDLAAQVVERWLLPSAEASCSEQDALDAPRGGDLRLSVAGPSGRLLVAAASPTRDGWRAVELVAAALDGPGGLLAKIAQGPVTAEARWLGGRRAPTLVIDIGAPADSIDAAAGALSGLLADLRQGGLPAADFSRAEAEVRQRRARDRRDPRKRVEALWLGGDERSASVDEARAFLSAALAPDRLVRIIEGP